MIGIDTCQQNFQNPKINIFEIKAKDITNKNTFKLINKEIKLENFKPDENFYIGIRPEDVSLEKNSEISIDISVDLVENLGAEKIVYSHLNDTEIRIKTNKNIKDKNITIYLPKNKIYLFNNNKDRFKI